MKRIEKICLIAFAMISLLSGCNNQSKKTRINEWIVSQNHSESDVIKELGKPDKETYIEPKNTDRIRVLQWHDFEIVNDVYGTLEMYVYGQNSFDWTHSFDSKTFEEIHKCFEEQFEEMDHKKTYTDYEGEERCEFITPWKGETITGEEGNYTVCMINDGTTITVRFGMTWTVNGK